MRKNIKDWMRAFAFVVFAVIASTPAWSLCNEEGGRVRTMYSEADIVFVGVIRSESADDFIDYEIEAKEWFKGTPRKVVHLQEGNDSGRTGFNKGQTYLVFASQATDQTGKDSGTVYTPVDYGCDGPEPFAFSKASGKVEEIKAAATAVARHSPAVVRVRVLDIDGGMPVEDSVFVFEGKSLTKTGKTGRDGRLLMELPEGIYQIRALGPGYVLTQHFNEDRETFEVKAGGGWDRLFYRWKNPEERRLIVFARDKDDKPLSAVLFSIKGESLSLSAKTGENGIVGFTVPAGRYLLRVNESVRKLFTVPFGKETYEFDFKSGGFTLEFKEANKPQ